MVNNRKQKNIILSIIMLILFCYPIFTIFNKQKLVGTIPLLYVYIAVAWIIALFLLIIAAEAKPTNKVKKLKDE